MKVPSVINIFVVFVSPIEWDIKDEFQCTYGLASNAVWWLEVQKGFPRPASIVLMES